MNAIGTNGQGHVDPIVDDERHTVPRSDLLDPSAQMDELARGRGLLAHLDHGHPSADGLLDDGFEREAPPPRHGGVGDQVEPEIGRRRSLLCW